MGRMSTASTIVFIVGILILTGFQFTVGFKAADKVDQIEAVVKSNNSFDENNVIVSEEDEPVVGYATLELLGIHQENVEATIRDYESLGFVWYENSYEGDFVNITFKRK